MLWRFIRSQLIKVGVQTNAGQHGAGHSVHFEGSQKTRDKEGEASVGQQTVPGLLHMAV